MKNCFLHIGHAKTATSSLQSFMHMNEDLFAAHGIWVPGDYRALASRDCTAIARSGADYSGNFGPIFDARVAGDTELFTALMNHVFSGNTDVLLSTELIFYYKYFLREVIKSANERGFVVTLIAYLRRQDRVVVPAYYQNIRNHGVHESLAAFLANTTGVRYFHYHEVMSLYAVAAPNRLVLRTFEPEFLVGGDIIADFTSMLGVQLPEEAIVRPRARVNPSLSLETLEVLRAMNALKRPDLVAQILARPNIDKPGASRRAWSYYYDANVAAIVEQQYMAGNAALISDYMQAHSQADRAYWMQPPDLPEPAPQLDTDGLAVALGAVLPPPG